MVERNRQLLCQESEGKVDGRNTTTDRISFNTIHNPAYPDNWGDSVSCAVEKGGEVECIS